MQIGGEVGVGCRYRHIRSTQFLQNVFNNAGINGRQKLAGITCGKRKVAHDDAAFVQTRFLVITAGLQRRFGDVERPFELIVLFVQQFLVQTVTRSIERKIAYESTPKGIAMVHFTLYIEVIKGRIRSEIVEAGVGNHVLVADEVFPKLFYCFRTREKPAHADHRYFFFLLHG